MIGQILDHYQLLHAIGDGGFGSVFMALDLNTRQTVAIKILHTERSNRADFADRLFDEARILRSLGHPNIVRLYNFGKADDHPYLVMEYLEGYDLREVLANEGTLPIRRGIHIMMQVAAALGAAAGRELVHCDIKPENIRILSDGMVKLMDFGISRSLDSQQRLEAGTWSYMAPELWRGVPPGHAADVYALGCVLYETLTGHPPFFSTLTNHDRGVRDEIAHLHMNTQPDWTPLDVDAIPPSLVTLLKEMLEKSPDCRPKVGEVHERLQNLADEVTVGARLTGTGLPRVVNDTTRSHGTATPPTDSHDHDTPTPRTPSGEIAVWPRSGTKTPDVVADRVVLQRSMAAVDLGSEACRTLLVHDGNLISATPDGVLFSIDLRTQRVQRWLVIPRDQISSQTWGLLGHRNTLVVYPGGTTLWELQAGDGQIRRQASLPEAGVTLVSYREWLYASSSRSPRLHRTTWSDLGNWQTFDLPARPTGVPFVTPSTVFLPTSQGLVFIDLQARHAQVVEPAQAARAVVALHQGMLAVLYTAVNNEDVQTSIVRLFAAANRPPRLLAETQAPGQSTGALLVAGSQLFLTCRSGCIWSWAAIEQNGHWHLNPMWSWHAAEGLSVQGGATLDNDVIALVPSAHNKGQLILLEATSGRELCAPQPLAGGTFVSPVWWERTVIVLLAKGTIEAFRMWPKADMRDP